MWPGATVWVLGCSLVVALGVAYGRALSPVAGWVVLGAGAAALAFVIVRMAARVEVIDKGVRAGAALLPWSAVGRTLPLDAEGARQARGPQGDPSAYLLLRPGVGPGAVVIEVLDPEDPHRTWLVATRHPDALARAIQQGHGSLAP
jgi:hypothetical protein